MRFLVLILFSSLIAACQSASKTTACAQADWYELGRRGGAAGQPLNLEKERHRCESDFQASQEAIYTNGYNNGLAEYCTASNGYSLGKAGALAQKTCPQPMDRDFLAAYARGKKVRELEISNEQLNRKISSVNEKLKSVQAKKQTQAITEKNQLVSELSGLEQERQANQRRLNEIEKQIN